MYQVTIQCSFSLGTFKLLFCFIYVGLIFFTLVLLNFLDKFGNSPLVEALKNGHDRVGSILAREGAALKIEDAGSFLCSVVARGDSDFLKRILANGIDPNSKDYDHRTPLHVAASEGLYLMATLLLDAGASVFSKDRYNSSTLLTITNIDMPAIESCSHFSQPFKVYYNVLDVEYIRDMNYPSYCHDSVFL